MLRTGRVGGEYTVEKQRILLECWHFFWKWNVVATFTHVASADNPADEPSRLKYEHEIRLRSEIFNALFLVSGPFDVDAMASFATCPRHPLTREKLPYVSRALDLDSRSINFFSVNWGQVLKTGERERVYVNPPFVMVGAVVSWLQQTKARGVCLVPHTAVPWPLWKHQLVRHASRCWKLPFPHSERRTPAGLEVCGGNIGDLYAYSFDFEAVRVGSLAEVEELPL
jgi:hypothetical protein